MRWQAGPPTLAAPCSPDHRGTRFTKRSERKQQRRLSANCPDSLMMSPHRQHYTEFILLARGPGPSEPLCAETVHPSPARTNACVQGSSCWLLSAPAGVHSALTQWLTSSVANEKCRLVTGFNVKIPILNLKV